MTVAVFLWTAFWALLPISEIRGALPYALANGMHPVLAYFYCVGCNALVGPVLYLFLFSLSKLLLKLKWYQKFFERFIERARKKIAPAVEKYGFWGITVFVAIPLPLTGAYTGVLGAWVMGMDKRKTMLAALTGVAIAGVAVMIAYYLVTVFGFKAFEFFFSEKK